MKQSRKLLNLRIGKRRTLAPFLLATSVSALTLVSGGPAAGADGDAIKPCATIGTLEASGDNTFVAPQREDMVIVIRPSQPKVGRPVVAWISGHQPGHLLVARRISWAFNNAASMLKGSGGGSASTIYLTPGKKTISVSMTDMSGKRKKATCSLSVIW